MNYDDYIKKSDHWQKVRHARFMFDRCSCAVCHIDLTNERYETHHITYLHLGNEHLTDVITLCSKHHAVFHNNWKKQDYWKGRENGHWEAFNIDQTARVCAACYKLDKFISKNADGPNLCNKDEIRKIIDSYVELNGMKVPPVIDHNDIMLFVRNKRWERVLSAADAGFTVEQFLDMEFGEKVRGKNKLRTDAGANSTYKHEIKSIRRHFGENKNIILLMQEVKKYEQT